MPRLTRCTSGRCPQPYERPPKETNVNATKPQPELLPQLKSNRTLPPRSECSIASLIWDGLYVVAIGKINLPLGEAAHRHTLTMS